MKELKNKSDYELRALLNGFALKIPSMISYEVGSEEYKKQYNLIYSELSQLKKKCYDNTKKFNVIVEYEHNKNKFEYECILEERNENEIIKRLNDRIWYNLLTNKKIKTPTFKNIIITEIKTK